MRARIDGLTPDKITKIAEKTKSLKRLFTELQANVEVASAFFTPLNIEEISDSVKKRAEEDNVVIIDKHLTMDILEKIRSGYLLNQILNVFGLRHIGFFL